MPICQLNVSMRIFTRIHRNIRFLEDGIIITNNNINYYLFLYVFISVIMDILLININPQKEISHNKTLWSFPNKINLPSAE